MNPESSIERQREVFLKALEKPSPAERAAYLDGACGDDSALRAQVEALLAHHATDSFLEDPAATAARPTLKLDLAAEEVSGTIIGRYKLLQKIGEGGCGVVYMAEQEEPVRRRVALKVIKLGMDSKSVIARFEAERQALALMDHPNIAKVFDGGTTETGRPYFVMELVRGIKITEYCDQHNLTTHERLNLFIQVCQAVQHAHQKGIIHRDLKPSNILVTVNDGVPVPKVIDFGIAKATEQKLTDKTLFTQFAQFIGTPAYMSPEQAEMTSLDIDTRSDIYALGVLLYELLTGKTPFDAQELLASGLDEMRRTIREQEPPRPSTRLSTMLDAELSTTAQHRRTESPRLVHLLRGDLDWIVMKALEKDRTRRYETANGFAADLQRHLKDEPVTARPPSNLYRFQKMARRNKVMFSAVSAVAAALIIGLSISTWLFFKERSARTRAVFQQQRAEDAETKAADEAQKAGEEAAVAQAVNEFLRNDLLSAAGSKYQADILRQPANPNLRVVEVLDRAAQRIGEQFRDQPLVEASIRYTIGSTYSDLGDDLAAIPHLERALELRRLRLGTEHEDTRASLLTLGRAYVDEARLKEAIFLFEELLRIETAKRGADDPVTFKAMSHLGICYARSNRISEGLLLLEEVLKKTEARFGRTNWNTIFAMNALSVASSQAGQLDKAVELDEVTLKILKAHEPDDPFTIMMTHNLAMSYVNIGKRVDAVPLFEDALKLRKVRQGAKHPDTLETAKSLAHAYQVLGRDAEAERLYQEILQATPMLGDSKAERRIPSLYSLADFFHGKGRYAEAEPLYREALQIARKNADRDPAGVDSAIRALANFFYGRHRPDEIDQILVEELDRETDPARRPRLLLSRGNVRARTGRWPEAIGECRKALELAPAQHEIHHALAPLLVQNGDLDGYRLHRQKILNIFGRTEALAEAERMAKDCLILPLTGPDLEAAVRMTDKAVSAGTNHPFTVYFQHVKSLAEYRRGHFAEAAEWAKKVLGNTGPDSHRDAQSSLVLAMSHQQLAQTAEARTALASAIEIIGTKMPGLDSGDLGGGWNDWIIAQVLLREAKTLIEGVSEQAKEADNKPAATPEAPP